jgi:hypothetical protein
MLTQFDPDKGPLFKGEFTSITVIDPAIPGHTGNLVFNPNKPFDIKLEWKLAGTDVPLYLAGADPTWSVEAFAESIGPGPEMRLAIGTLPKGASVNPASYSHTLTVPAGTLPEGNPFPGQPSGVYKIVCTVFLNSSVPGGFDIAGFVEGPVIRMEDPE